MKNNFSNVNIISTENYVRDFLPTLSNFCSKCPLQPSITYIAELGKIIVKTNKKELTYIIDTTIPKKSIIRDIKENLVEDYPIIYSFEEKPIDTIEAEKLIENGESIADVLSKKKLYKTPKYRVERRLDKYNELDLLDLKTGELSKYKCTIPISILLSNLQENKDVLPYCKFQYKLEKKEKPYES